MVAFSTYRKRKVFLAKGIADFFCELCEGILKPQGIQIVTVFFYEGHGVVIELCATAPLLPNKIVSMIKRGTTDRIRQQFMELHSMPSLWTRKTYSAQGKLTDVTKEELEFFFDSLPSRS